VPLDPVTNAVYESKAAEWTAARVGKDISAATRLVGRLSTEVGDSTPRPMLDLGCGPGYLTAALPDGSIGLDPARAMLDLLAHRVPATLGVQGEAGALPFQTGSLGGAIAASVYVHIDRPALPMVLHELHRTLEIGAPIELVMFGGDQDLTPLDEGDFPGRSYSLWPPEHLLDVVVGAGFEIEHHNTQPSLSWPTITIGARRARSLADTVGPDMRLLVCGLNPSLHSADLGVGFGRGGNRFWPAALAAGLVTLDRDAPHALAQHGIGMTDLVKRATPRADALTRSEYETGLTRLRHLCEWLEPQTVCMVGLAGWRAAANRKAVAGWQPEQLGSTPVYVMPSTSGLNAHSQLGDLTDHLRNAVEGR